MKTLMFFLNFCRALGADYDIKLAARLYEVQQDIELRGTYDLTYEELVFGARTAWRNAPRCVNRIVWRQLEVCKVPSHMNMCSNKHV